MKNPFPSYQELAPLKLKISFTGVPLQQSSNGHGAEVSMDKTLNTFMDAVVPALKSISGKGEISQKVKLWNPCLCFDVL